MGSLSEKLYRARVVAHLNQEELGAQVGVSRRSIIAYEGGQSIPRKAVLRRLAQTLGVTEYYLTHDDCDDPDEGQAREKNLNMVRERFGAKGAKEAAALLEKGSVFFAGGDISQEDKDALFDALMTAYVTAKNEARAKFTPKSVKAAVKNK
jgi:Predicted transcriptional regulators